MSEERFSSIWTATHLDLKDKFNKTVERVLAFFKKHPMVLPIASFVAGVLSFVLVDRQMGLATPIIFMLILSWIWFEGETLFNKAFERLTSYQIPPVLVAFAAQGLHQETLFFVLPFVLIHTVWTTLHAVFSVIVVILALVSVLDYFYYPVVHQRWSRTLVHAFVTFLVIFVSLPQVVHLTTSSSLKIACVMMSLLSLPTVYRTLKLKQPVKMIVTVLVASTFGLVLWFARPMIPPTNLRISEMYPSLQLDRAAREATPHSPELTVAEVRQGVWVYSSIRAPQGLKEDIYHKWYWEGRLMDRVKLSIQGGRKEGFRSWSRKDHFPKQPYGTWQVTAATLSGQHIGSCTFEVVPGGEASKPVASPKAPETKTEESVSEKPSNDGQPKAGSESTNKTAPVNEDKAEETDSSAYQAKKEKVEPAEPQSSGEEVREEQPEQAEPKSEKPAVEEPEETDTSDAEPIESTPQTSTDTPTDAQDTSSQSDDDKDGSKQF